MRRARLWAPAVAAMVCLLLAGTSVADVSNVARGKMLYRRHCARCHGHAGRGDGPVGRMLQCKPVDLTGLSEDGDFPRQEVLDFLNHATLSCEEMPDWRGVLTQDDMGALLGFLETIQAR